MGSAPLHCRSLCAALLLTLLFVSQPFTTKANGSISEPLSIRGINYGGRFIPERWLDLPGMGPLYGSATPGCSSAYPRPCVLSTCDLAAWQPDEAGDRMLKYLNDSILESDFKRIATEGFNFVRLPLGYWQLVESDVAPDAPSHTAVRWHALQKMLPAAAYRIHILRVLRYASENNLRVLLDLHGAPGGQSINQCTGCATSCEGSGCEEEAHYFDRPRNHAVAIAAVVELAKLCALAGPTCFGVELLNEPAQPEPLGGGNCNRTSLLENYYVKAILAARNAGLPPAVPIVIMDCKQRALGVAPCTSRRSGLVHTLRLTPPHLIGSRTSSHLASIS